jgi:hypothetical protein
MASGGRLEALVLLRDAAAAGLFFRRGGFGSDSSIG